jgi:predicted ATP-grasp superfamily ATP-dependent carboligase
MTETSQQRTAVLVLRSGHHGGLGIVRSLGRLGIPVYCADAVWWETAFSSRYCRGRFLLDLEGDSGYWPLDRLLEIGKKLGGRPLLMPTTDEGAIWVSANAEALEERFRFTRLDVKLVRTLCDKGRMQDLAQRCGLPVARSVVPQCREDLDQFASESMFPVMVKATHAARVRRRTGGTKFLVHTADELRELYGKAQDDEGPNLLVQEFIPGEDWMFDGYFDADSRCVFGITGKKIRRFPARTGVTSLGVCLRNDVVRSITAEFMQAIRYRGILDIGYRYDWRDGQYKVMDVNPRIGCTFRLFTGADGMDVARALYLDQTGQPVPSAPAIEGRKWIVEDFDLFSTVRSLWDRTLSLKDWAKSLTGIDEAACFASDDPLPFLMMGVSDTVEISKWLRRRAALRKGVVPEEEEPALIASTRRR